jgi:hypothetical protein
MVVFRVENTPVEFVFNVNEDRFSVVHEHQLCIFGKFHSLSVMVMKYTDGSSVHLRKCV